MYKAAETKLSTWIKFKIMLCIVEKRCLIYIYSYNIYIYKFTSFPITWNKILSTFESLPKKNQERNLLSFYIAQKLSSFPRRRRSTWREVEGEKWKMWPFSPDAWRMIAVSLLIPLWKIVVTPTRYRSLWSTHFMPGRGKRRINEAIAVSNGAISVAAQ